MENLRKPKSHDKDVLFCKIEQGKTSEVLQFFEIYKPYLSEIYTSISWNILMYVIRFGNLELFSYLWPIREKFENTSGYTYVHAACFGNELDMLKILVDEKKETVNPISLQISENTPLRFACKAGYLEQIEYLISRGAYYYDEVDGYCHNHIKYEINGEIKFKSFDGNDIPCGFIVSLTGNIPDTNIREYIRSLRFRNYSCVLKSLNMNKEEPKNKQIESISKILNYSKAKERIEVFMGIKREFSF